MWGNVAWSVVQRVETQSSFQWHLHRTQVLLDFAKECSDSCRSIKDLLIFIKRFLSMMFRVSECTFHAVFADFTANIQLDRSTNTCQFVEHNGINGEFRGIVGEVASTKKAISCTNMSHPRFDSVVDICSPDFSETSSTSAPAISIEKASDAPTKVTIEKRASTLHTFPVMDGCLISGVLQFRLKLSKAFR